MGPEEERQRGLTRERLVEAALALIKEEGIDGLSMRALADRLEVKAASLYWHVRDRRELVELLAEAILGSVRPRTGQGGWRHKVVDLCSRLSTGVAGQRDAARILLEAPEVLESSDVYAEMKRQLQDAGLQPAEAAEVALMIIVHVIAGRTPADEPPTTQAAPASLAIDSGSRGVVLRAGAGMETLVRASRDLSGVAPSIVHGETLTIRRLRGAGMGEIELDPRRSWRFKVQAPTWNNVIDASGLDVREIRVDSGASKLECTLPMPRGRVPIHLSSGVVDITLHRPPGAAVTAIVHTGAVKVKLDGYSAPVVIADARWETPGGSSAVDRYELEISSGVVKVSLDDTAKLVKKLASSPAQAAGGEPAPALEILLDGVEARVRQRR